MISIDKPPTSGYTTNFMDYHGGFIMLAACSYFDSAAMLAVLAAGSSELSLLLEDRCLQKR